MKGAVAVERVAEADLRAYLALAQRFNDRPNRVPALLGDEAAFHDPRRNTPLAGCERVRFIARVNGRPAGRIMGIIHHRHNERVGERAARFYQLDCRRDEAVAHALLTAVARWAQGLGMERLVGPFGLSDKDPQGVQVEGFEHLPVIATPSNAQWLPPMIESFGFTKLIDAVSYRVDIPTEAPALHRAISSRVLASGHFRLLEFKRRCALKPWVVPVLQLVNSAYGGLYGFEPMEEQEMRRLARQYMPVLEPDLVKVLVDERDAPVAFVVAMPDMSEGLRRSKGRLLPFGWWHILRAMRRSRQLDLLLGAVRPDLQGRGLTCALGIALLESARARGFTHMDSHLVLEGNRRMRAELERLGGAVWKRYRIYHKHL